MKDNKYRTLNWSEFVELLKDRDIWSRYTPNVKLGRHQTMVLLEIDTRFVKNSISVSEELNKKYLEMGGENENGYMTVTDPLQDEVNFNELLCYSEDYIKKHIQEMEEDKEKYLDSF